jgi:hypothetical protein
MIGGGECLSPHYLTLVSWFYKEVQNEHKTFIRFQGNIIVLLFSTTFIAEKNNIWEKSRLMTNSSDVIDIVCMVLSHDVKHVLIEW